MMGKALLSHARGVQISSTRKRSEYLRGARACVGTLECGA